MNLVDEQIILDSELESWMKDENLDCQLRPHQHFPYECSGEAVAMLKIHFLTVETPVCKIVYDAVSAFLAQGLECGLCHQHCMTIRPI